MSNRKKPNSGRRSSKSGHSGIAAHKREGKQLVAPMNTFNPTSVPWLRDVFPHMLWMCAVLNEHGVEDGTSVIVGVIDGLDPWIADAPAASQSGLEGTESGEADGNETDGGEADGGGAITGSDAETTHRDVATSPPPLLDGTLGAFDLIAESDRAEVLAALRADGLYDDAFPRWFVAAMSRYESVPGAWILGQDGKDRVALDPGEVEGRLRDVVFEAWHGKTEVATRAKMLLARAYLKAGRLFLGPSDSSLPGLLANYPNGLDAGRRQMAEATMRAMFLTLWSMRPETAEAERDWATRFWRRNWELYDCVFASDSVSEPVLEDRAVSSGGMPDDDAGAGADADRVPGEREAASTDAPSAGGSGAAAGDRPKDEAGAREASWARAQEVWEQRLSDIEQRFLQANRAADPDLFSPDRNEVMTGITSRHLRSMQAMIRLPGLWSVEHGSGIVRGLVEGRIVQKWLIFKDDPDLFTKFKQYGLGHLKLHILHLREYAESGDGPTDGLDATIAGLEELLERDVMEEFQNISIDASFTSTNTRQMAIAVGLEREYRLVFSPSSANVHSEWIALEQYALRPCGNPLHRGHRIPNTDVRVFLGAEVVELAFGTIEDLVEDYIKAV